MLVADGSADDASQGRLHLLRKPGGAGSVGVEDSFYWSLCSIVRFHLCHEVRQKAPADDTLSCLSGSKAEAVAQAAAAVVRLWTRFVPPIPSETWGEGLLDAQCLPLLLVACAAAAWSGQWHVSL